MATDPKKYSSSWLYGTLLVGAAMGAVIYYFALPKEPCPPCPVPAVKWTSCFDLENVEALLGATDGWGARFYLAKAEGGGYAVLGAPIKEEGSHIPEADGTLRFRLYKGISGERTDMLLLDETAAVEAVKAVVHSGRPTWSVEVKGDVLRGLLSISGANGIGFLERRSTDGIWTFELAPVRLAGGAAEVTGSPGDILVGASPCPVNCPRPPEYYLHLR
ncbi:MAG: hypothetical protein QY325_01260 [Flavobacteriales bacterium]|nr:MAG: hypothetical protein QY325_01260 [Flavobacteriales bacterium]